MNLYLALDVLIAAFPIALSFHRKVRSFHEWRAAALAALLVGIPFIAWDAFMTLNGAWGFSEKYAGSLRILLLPPGELGFFLSVPFSCLFIYQAVGAYFKERTLAGGRLPWLAVSAACAAAAVLLRGRLYTSTVLSVTGAFLLVAVLLSPDLLSSRRFWLAIGLSYVPFLIFNGILTALPVVTYGEKAIIGIRVGSIPVEDFLYSFALVGFAILAFTRMPRRRAPPEGRQRGR
jgi:lycopene cyclase domain-containing protein